MLLYMYTNTYTYQYITHTSDNTYLYNLRPTDALEMRWWKAIMARGASMTSWVVGDLERGGHHPPKDGTVGAGSNGTHRPAKGSA